MKIYCNQMGYILGAGGHCFGIIECYFDAPSECVHLSMWMYSGRMRYAPTAKSAAYLHRRAAQLQYKIQIQLNEILL